MECSPSAISQNPGGKQAGLLPDSTPAVGISFGLEGKWKSWQISSENGIVLISATVSKKNKILLVGPEVTTRGFIYVKDSGEMIKEIKNISLAIIERNITSNYIDFNNIKNEIREER